jgi:hypothetical protein
MGGEGGPLASGSSGTTGYLVVSPRVCVAEGAGEGKKGGGAGGAPHGGTRRRAACCSQGFFIQVSWTEPASSGTGIPVRFEREPEETEGIQISIQNPSSIGLDQYTGPVQSVTCRWNKSPESVENLTCFQIWIKNSNNKRIFSKNIARCIESNGAKKI